MTDTFRKKYSSSEELMKLQSELKQKAEQLEVAYQEIGQSREMSLAMTNLEQSIMWAVKAMYMKADK